MADTDGPRTLNGRLLQSGWELNRYIPDIDFSEAMTKLALDHARGEYQHVQLIPGYFALDGSDWLPEQTGHIVYVKYRKQLTRRIPYVQINLIHRKTNEKNNTTPLHALD